MKIELINDSFVIKTGTKASKPLEGFIYAQTRNVRRGANAARRALLNGRLVPNAKRSTLILTNAMGYPLAEQQYSNKQKMEAARKSFQTAISNAKRSALNPIPIKRIG